MKKATPGASQALKGAKPNSKTDAASLLKADHRAVEAMFQQFEETEDQKEKGELVRQVCLELIVHTRLEEELFYPACREKSVENDLMDEAQVEHDGAKVLIADLLQAEPGDAYYDAKVKTLSEYIHHHVAEEEKPRSGIFARAQKAGVDMASLGEKLGARKKELMEESEAMTSRPPQPRSFRLQPQKDTSMPRNSNDRDRDERGRFTDDDHNQGGYQSRGQNQDRDERGRFTDDNNQGSYESRGQNRDRDERGRFTDDDDNRGGGRGGYQSRSSGRDRDEEGRFTSDDSNGGSSRGGRGHGGWSGDPEGHSRAAHEGWEDRGSSRSRDYNDDDRGRGSRGGQDRGHGGWFGDPQGHSQASREGWRNSSHEGSGWYGDPRRHSEASREGWEDRGNYSGRQSGRGRDEEDGNRGSRGGRGPGGWFGDSEGHSQASREGWRNR